MLCCKDFFFKCRKLDATSHTSVSVGEMTGWCWERQKRCFGRTSWARKKKKTREKNRNLEYKSACCSVFGTNGFWAQALLIHCFLPRNVFKRMTRWARTSPLTSLFSEDREAVGNNYLKRASSVVAHQRQSRKRSYNSLLSPTLKMPKAFLLTNKRYDLYKLNIPKIWRDKPGSENEEEQIGANGNSWAGPEKPQAEDDREWTLVIDEDEPVNLSLKKLDLFNLTQLAEVIFGIQLLPGPDSNTTSSFRELIKNKLKVYFWIAGKLIQRESRIQSPAVSRRVIQFSRFGRSGRWSGFRMSKIWTTVPEIKMPWVEWRIRL